MTTWQNWIDNQGARVAAAEADAKHLRAVKILDAWAGKQKVSSPQLHRGPRGECFWIDVYLPTTRSFKGATPAACRIAAADALANEDPSLLEGIES